MQRTSTERFFFIGPRVKIARRQMRLSQQQLAKQTGLSNAAVAAIENSQRGVNFPEIEKLAKAIGKDHYYFKDPFLLVCEEQFRYLTTAKVGVRDLRKTEKTMNHYVGIFRFLLNYFSKKNKQQAPKLDIQLPFTTTSTAEFAVNAGERIAHLLELGTTPIEKLQSALEDKLGIMTLMLDIDNQAIAGASLSLPELGFICVNRHLPKNERSFAIAHELFHLLTWNSLPFDRNTKSKPKLRKVEEFADQFASSLLMPRQTVVQIEGIGKKQQATKWVVEHATDLGVSAQALQVRIKQLEAQRGQSLAPLLEQLNLASLEAKIKDSKPARPFSKLYVELIARGIDEPVMSAMSGTQCLGCETFHEAGDLFYAYGVAAPETMRFAMPDSNIRKKRKKGARSLH